MILLDPDPEVFTNQFSVDTLNVMGCQHSIHFAIRGFRTPQNALGPFLDNLFPNMDETVRHLFDFESHISIAMLQFIHLRATVIMFLFSDHANAFVRYFCVYVFVDYLTRSYWFLT